MEPASVQRVLLFEQIWYTSFATYLYMYCAKYDLYLLKILMNPAFNTVSLKSQVNVSAIPIVHVVLIEYIIETFI